MVEMHLAAVRVEMATSTPILLLQEAGEGNRTLPIYIGQAEAQAIAQELQEIVAPRPMTHDLMRDLLAELGATVDCVVITELRDRTFYAEIRLTLGGTKHAVSARPSDAIALAVRTHSTIYAEDALLDAEGVVLASDETGDDEEPADADELVSQFKEFIEGIRPEDFEG
ncbi:MAG TPA: bifunctional nuclease family protein [Acidimicrobiales bacterium]|nr:bifunctional nuclease family protein [Acidimicrobiales bacterium]